MKYSIITVGTVPLLQYLGNMHGCPYFFRIRQNATNRFYETSNDGKRFVTYFSEAAGNFLSETEAGFYLSASNADIGIIVHSLKIDDLS